MNMKPYADIASLLFPSDFELFALRVQKFETFNRIFRFRMTSWTFRSFSWRIKSTSLTTAWCRPKKASSDLRKLAVRASTRSPSVRVSTRFRECFATFAASGGSFRASQSSSGRRVTAFACRWHSTATSTRTSSFPFVVTYKTRKKGRSCCSGGRGRRGMEMKNTTSSTSFQAWTPTNHSDLARRPTATC